MPVAGSGVKEEPGSHGWPCELFPPEIRITQITSEQVTNLAQRSAA